MEKECVTGLGEPRALDVPQRVFVYSSHLLIFSLSFFALEFRFFSGLAQHVFERVAIDFFSNVIFADSRAAP